MKTIAPINDLLWALLLLCNSQAWGAQSILIESAESKTKEQTPVYNRIEWYSKGDQDVWLMQQSHAGASAKAEKWEHLAIVVDHRQTPAVARFYQLDQNQKQIDYRVSCLICHNNGPRAIRPNWSSNEAKVPLIDRMRIYFWNLRIKSYSRIEAQEAPLRKPRKVPLSFSGNFNNEKLTLPACARCHQDSGLIGRGYLKRQNAITIRYLLKQGQMPPFPFSISKEEKIKLDAFMDGV